MANYTSMYSHPLWKAKRKEVLARDSHTCQQCGATTTLQVHHKKYIRRIWESPLEDLATLCKTCHARAKHKVEVKPISVELPSWSIHKGYTDISFYLIHSTGRALLIEGAEAKLYWLPGFAIKDISEGFWLNRLNTVAVYKTWVSLSKFRNAVVEN
jgi:phage terminase large subunit GpA-like protein